MKVIAIMPLKLNNERLPGKNTKLLGGKPLLQYELHTLQKVDGLDEIIVYCSDDSVRSFLPDGIHFCARPNFLDLPTSNFTQIFENFIIDHDADIYMYAHATAPFITRATMQDCLDAVRSEKYDSAFCASKIQDFLWQDNKPLNFDASNISRSQDLRPIYRETSGVYVFKKEVFEKYRQRIGKNPFIKEVSYKEAVDINEPADFLLAQALLKVDL